MFELEGIDHVALAVHDVGRLADWYVEVLGFERRHVGMWNGVPVFIGKGATAIALFPRNDKRKEHTPERLLHIAFRATRAEFLKAQDELTDRNLSFEFQDHEISHSIYFRDPEGHELEITTYETR